MKSMLKSLCQLHREEAGQGLVEYVLLIALVALAATVGMKGLANSINSAFGEVGSVLATNVT
jgi:pilus assembly protein Flp/PilA